MNELEKKLLDFNQQMINYRFAFGQAIDPQPATSSFKTIDFTTNPPQEVSSDVIDVNPEEVEVTSNIPPPKVFRGPRGKRGKRGPAGQPGKDSSVKKNFNTKVVSNSYAMEPDDDVIIVHSTDMITITLPKDVQNGKMVVIKLMADNSSEHRKVAVRNTSAGMIDSSFYFEMKYPFESLSLIYYGGDWCVISNYKGII